MPGHWPTALQFVTTVPWPCAPSWRITTLLQFSTDTCGKCPAVHRTLFDVAAGHEGVTHLNVDLTHRPDIAKHFHVVQTPTTFILDSNGAVQTRFGGAARRDVVELELARVVADLEPAYPRA